MKERAASLFLGNLQVQDETQNREQEDEQRPYPFKKGTSENEKV